MTDGGSSSWAFRPVEVDCHCYRCWYEAQPDDVHRVYARMHLCCDCGNKRCPKATDHREGCSGSNDTGQKFGDWERERFLKQLEIMRKHLTAEELARLEDELEARSDSR